ncbi:hypothetical protein HYQ44_013485 [Verticillium longisporum]|nr:hypothetical protein HYQ44_013485 [Verticillium longisporum]
MTSIHSLGAGNYMGSMPCTAFVLSTLCSIREDPMLAFRNRSCGGGGGGMCRNISKKTAKTHCGATAHTHRRAGDPLSWRPV